MKKALILLLGFIMPTMITIMAVSDVHTKRTLKPEEVNTEYGWGLPTLIGFVFFSTAAFGFIAGLNFNEEEE